MKRSKEDIAKDRALIRKYQARVKKGIAWLDSIKKTWYKDIELHNLAMDDSMTCVIGQVFGEYMLAIADGYSEEYNVLNMMNTIKKSKRLTNEKAQSYGFNIIGYEDDTQDDWDILTYAWRCAIMKKLAQ